MGKEVIVLCEKDSELRKSLALVLEQEYEIHEAVDFNKAVNLVNDIGAGALVVDLDYAHSSKDDYNKFTEFKNKHPELPIISMYVYTRDSSRDEPNIRLFSDAVLYKPVDINQLLETLKKIHPPNSRN